MLHEGDCSQVRNRLQAVLTGWLRSTAVPGDGREPQRIGAATRLSGEFGVKGNNPSIPLKPLRTQVVPVGWTVWWLG
jgi:hypothetical protein